ncbi:hypothetical protein CICLE_v10030050mg [Citrus x clementina]|uniref:Malectin-like domain-containing protein n=1 Tax=Citrus clementina TaxID=85681 RepID=V4SLK5_CITCL|nr:hypothetical protein CICLE_v10030050mg [Citrus x clementina]
MANSSLVLIILTLFILSASAQVFVSIDCGASGSYKDENSIAWIGDDDLIQNGESKVVQSGNALSDDHVMSSLRVFSTRKKNCYTILASKGGQVLVRASFNYGNYDKKSSPPSFDLHFDGNLWATVKTSSEGLVYYEAIYVVKGDSISVCVAQTNPNQLPFISAIEVRSLGSHMYSHVDAAYALFLRSRTAYGANGTIRYSDDGYDRIWNPAVIGSGLNMVTSDALFIDVNVEDEPPQAVMQNAITASTASQSIALGTNFPTEKVPIYITMYFSEVTELDSTQKRAFQFRINNKPDSDTIVPPYGKVTELYVSNMSASSNTSFSLVATADSTLPPLINAMEVFTVSDQLADGTNSKDVEGLAAFQNQFDTLQDWGGDPCLPSPYSWDWINCSADATPRVTALYLRSFDLSGPLPDFSSMDALEIIDLHNNSFNGAIPDFLGNLPSLKELNLADNKFSGPVPSSLSKNNKLKLVVSGNPDLCVTGKSCTQTTAGDSTPVAGGGKKKSSKLPVILGTSIPGFFVFWGIVGLVAVLHHRRKSAAIAAHGSGGTPHGGATNTNMADKIGQAVMNEIKVNIQEQVTSEISDYVHQTVQNDQQDGRNA